MENFTLHDLAAIVIGLGVFVVVSMLLEDNARRARMLYSFIMSLLPSAPTGNIAGMGRYTDQSANTGLNVQTNSGQQHGMEHTDDRDWVDIDGADSGMGWKVPPISRYLTDDEFITLLAAQKLRDGAYRLSANKIVQAAGGDRNHVLAIVRVVRSGPAEYPERTPEQLAAREALGLDRV